MKKYFLFISFIFSGFILEAQQKTDTSCYSEKFEDYSNVSDENNIFKAGTSTNEPYYKGGILKWKEFLEKNVQFDEIIKTVSDSIILFIDSAILKFIVSKSGRLSNIEVLYAGNNEIQQESIRLVRSSCLIWTPALVGSGRSVHSWHIEKFAFIVEKKDGEIKTKIGIIK